MPALNKFVLAKLTDKITNQFLAQFKKQVQEVIDAYIRRERDRETERDTETKRKQVGLSRATLESKVKDFISILAPVLT